MNENTEQSVEVEEKVEVETTDESLKTEDSVEEVEVEAVESDSSAEEEHKPSRNQNAKQRLRRKLRESEAENERLRSQNDKIATLESKLDSVINPPPARPNRVDFETEEEYEDSLFEWRDASKPQQPQPTSEPVQEQSALGIAPEVQKKWLDDIDAMADKHDDFEDVLVSIPKENMTEAMTFAIMEAEQAGEIAYFLGQNHKEADRISKLSIASQVREIDKLGNKFITKPTTTPEPIKPVGGKGSPVTDVDNMSAEEYHRYRNEQRAGRR